MFASSEGAEKSMHLSEPSSIDTEISAKFSCDACVKRPLSKRLKTGFQDQLLLNAGQRHCRIFQPSLSYQFPFRPLYSLFLSGRFRQALLHTFLIFILYIYHVFVNIYLFSLFSIFYNVLLDPILLMIYIASLYTEWYCIGVR